MTDGSGKTEVDLPETEGLHEAFERARAKHAELGSDEFDAVSAAALAHAEDAARDDRELVALFETELDRRVEERSVLGSPGSVLPSSSADAAEIPSTLRAAPQEAPVEASPAVAEPALSATERARVPASPQTGMDYVLAAAALRFHHGLEPAEIAGELGVDREYYARCMRWFIRRVESGLEAPGHVNRNEMALFAAGMTSIEQGFKLERHARECRSCSEYLAGLLDGAIGMLEPATSASGVAAQASPQAQAEPRPASLATQGGRTSFTTTDVWAAGSRRARPRPEVPIMTLKAQSLRRYMPAADPSAAEPDPLDAQEAAAASECPLARPPGPLVARLRERRALLDRLPSLPQLTVGRRGYATAAMALLAGMSAVESGAAVAGVGSPAVHAFDELRQQSGLGSPNDDGPALADKAGPGDRDGGAATDGSADPPPPPPASTEASSGELVDLSSSWAAAEAAAPLRAGSTHRGLYGDRTVDRSQATRMAQGGTAEGGMAQGGGAVAQSDSALALSPVSESPAAPSGLTGSARSEPEAPTLSTPQLEAEGTFMASTEAPGQMPAEHDEHEHGRGGHHDPEGRGRADYDAPTSFELAPAQPPAPVSEPERHRAPGPAPGAAPQPGPVVDPQPAAGPAPAPERPVEPVRADQPAPQPAPAQTDVAPELKAVAAAEAADSSGSDPEPEDTEAEIAVATEPAVAETEADDVVEPEDDTADDQESADDDDSDDDD